MPSNILTNDTIAKAAMAILKNETDVLKTFYRGYEEDFGAKKNGYKEGDTITIRRPIDPSVRRTVVASVQESIEGSVDLKVNKPYGSDLTFSTTDRTLSIENFTERFIKPAVTNIVQTIISDAMGEFYPFVNNWVGTAGSTIDSYSDFLVGTTRMNKLAIPMDNRFAVLDETDHAALVGALPSLFVAGDTNRALKEGKLPMLNKVGVMSSNFVKIHTVGDHGGTPLVRGASQNVTYDSVKTSSLWSQTLATDGWSTTKVLKKGDVFTISGVNAVNPRTKENTGFPMQFTLVANVTTNANSANETTLTISPPIISSGAHQNCTAAPADDAPITVKGTANTGYQQNLFYHKNSMAIVFVPREIPAGAADVSRITEDGISVMLEPVRDGVNDTSFHRLDVLCGFKCIDPRLAVRVSGT